MKTIVVHVNDPRFRDNPEAVYIGRKCPRAHDERARRGSVIWQNKHRASRCGSAERAIAEYAADIRYNLKYYRQAWVAYLMDLDGKVLGCWCKKRGDEPCHGDVLVKLIEELKGRTGEPRPTPAAQGDGG